MKNIGFSFGLHLAGMLLLGLLALNETESPSLKKNEKVLQVKNISQKEFLKKTQSQQIKKAAALLQKKKQIVQMDERLKSKKKPVTQEKVFLSKHHQRVDKNTRAKNFGDFKNVLKEGTQQAKAVRKKATVVKTVAQKKESAPKKIDLFKGLTQLSSKTLSDASAQGSGTTYTDKSIRSPSGITSKGDGISANDDYLQDVAIGANTLLNTKEFIHYGFFNRIREELVAIWRDKVKNAADEAMAHGKAFSRGEKITKLDIYLDENGQLQKSVFRGLSGVDALDKAAKIAFQEAAPFPNPPKQMRDKNGYLKVQWDFVVVNERQIAIDFKVNGF